MRIMPSGTRGTVRGDVEFNGNFTGNVWIDHLVRPGEDSDMSVQSVYFTPGSHSDWHMHPNGQILHIVAGQGRIQVRGGAVQALRAGDTVVAPPGEWHWHGAAPDTSMTMFAVQQPDESGTLVEWAKPSSETAG